MIWAPIAPYSRALAQETTDFTFSEETKRQLEERGIDWAEEEQIVLEKVFDLAAQLDAKAKEFIESHQPNGEAELIQAIDGNKFQFEFNGGTAEYRRISGKRLPRILLHNNDKVYLLHDETELPLNDPHLRQYIARTHIESGENRPYLDKNGEQKRFLGLFKRTKSGRDLIIVSVKRGQVDGARFLPKPKATQWSWWKDYFYAKYKRPDFNDFTLALIMGAALQGGMALGMSAIKAGISGQPMDFDVPAFAAGYAFLLGLFQSTYRNWAVLHGTPFSRAFKQTGNSLTFAYGVVLFLGEGTVAERVATVSILSAAGLSKFASIFTNAMVNNSTKDFWNRITRIRDKARANITPVKFGLEFFGQKYQAEWKRATIESQLLYMIPWTINLISLMTLASSSGVVVPGTEIKLPILQFLALPVAIYWARQYSEKVAQQAQADTRFPLRAKEMREMADSYNKTWQSSFGWMVNRGRRAIGSVCSRLLGASRQE